MKDVRGAEYPLDKKLAEGGQGVVYTTKLPGVLIKGFTSKDEAEKQRWHTQIEWLIRQDLADLKLARPLILLAPPHTGYVMELMDGLVPLASLLDSFIEAAATTSEDDPAPHIADYLAQGGLQRRIHILCQLARTLNQLHSRGMLYGDLSPANIFVSDDPSHAETWLIDCDNISYECHSGLSIHTPDYGAPEVVRGEALLSSLTDCWSFVVIAWQLLTHNHPLKGELIEDGEPELEDAALRGEYPWIGDEAEVENACYNNLPLQLIEHSELLPLFRLTFEAGRTCPRARPDMARWLAALSALEEQLYRCPDCAGNTLIPAPSVAEEPLECFFCGTPADDSLVMFEECIQLSETARAEQFQPLDEPLYPTGRRVYLQPGDHKELKRLLPSFSYDQAPSDNIQLDYTDQALIIQPVGPLHISRGEGNLQTFEKKPVRLPASRRGQHDLPYHIHLGDPDDTHVLWRLRW